MPSSSRSSFHSPNLFCRDYDGGIQQVYGYFTCFTPQLGTALWNTELFQRAVNGADSKSENELVLLKPSSSGVLAWASTIARWNDVLSALSLKLFIKTGDPRKGQLYSSASDITITASGVPGASVVSGKFCGSKEHYILDSVVFISSEQKSIRILNYRAVCHSSGRLELRQELEYLAHVTTVSSLGEAIFIENRSKAYQSKLEWSHTWHYHKWHYANVVNDTAHRNEPVPTAVTFQNEARVSLPSGYNSNRYGNHKIFCSRLILPNHFVQTCEEFGIRYLTGRQ
ncbi:hypothetical protein RRG08_030787 [Elysia crispata]|uniref:Uncharacterized protein n=1 Tax=Elysia crispata TaxID=231223 RepID=A0AAE0YFM6_9GAST|nr:hypothetical protein RRG08_030787 [Elysia crispata]